MNAFTDYPEHDASTVAHAYIYEALQQRYDNAHTVISFMLNTLDPKEAAELLHRFSEIPEAVDAFDAVMGDGWIENMVRRPDVLAHRSL